jgi:UDP-GlcNAc:undecaprenyl-phosphate GlcNAc-1-phosphate transferase
LITYIISFLLAFILSLVINGAFVFYAKPSSITDKRKDQVRWSDIPKPSCGGISFYIVFLLSLCSIAVMMDDFNIFADKEMIGIVVSLTLAFFMGWADDSYNVTPVIKVVMQILCGLFLIWGGISINVFGNAWIDYSLTMLCIVGIMNSINMLDNMDGIATLVSILIISTVAFLIILQFDFRDVYFLLMVGAIGALLGFLIYNWHPSKIFMGDSGSQFLGLFMAIIAIKYLWNSSDGLKGEEIARSKPFALNLLTFILPAVDTTFVFINRLRRGASPFVGGNDHTTHQLSYYGFSDRQVALIFIILGLISLTLVIFAQHLVVEWNHFYTLVYFIYFLILLLMFFIIGESNKVEI